jgi:energy-coupling factor transporter ATP-binding protein EcfA2
MTETSDSAIVSSHRTEDTPGAGAQLGGERPGLYVSEVTFSDGTSLALQQGDFVLIVGPNNVGKSEVLRALHGKAAEPNTPSPVVESASWVRIGTAEQLESWLIRTSKVQGNTPQRNFRRLGGQMHEHIVRNIWSNEAQPLSPAAHIFIAYARTEGRIHESNPPQQLGLQDPVSHPLHNILFDDALELKLSERFQAAFGKELVLNWRAGQMLPLHVGARPVRTAESDRVSNAYVEHVVSLPRLDAQGDGMRSFTTLLLYVLATDAPLLFIDEPEAFLHPPQARLSGELLGTSQMIGRQTLVATHSSDFIRGALTKNPAGRVVRLTRAQDRTSVHVVPSEAVRNLWSDPLLRYSNALDGLFHEAVVICEGDADCRFYEALLHSVETAEGRTPPDFLFTFTSGKSRMGTLKQALKSAGIRTIAICDFDVLREDAPLNSLLPEAVWIALQSKVQSIRGALNQKMPSIPRAEVGSRIGNIIVRGTAPAISDDERKDIKELLKGTSIWTMAKQVGVSILPGGSVSIAGRDVIEDLWRNDVAVVQVGELEGFCRTVTATHGPAWVEEVMRRDLLNDPELAEARAFVTRIAQLVRS